MVKRYDVKSVRSPQGRFSHVGEVAPGARIYYLAGQTGNPPEGEVARDFAKQAEQVYGNILAVLKDCGMTAANIAKLTVYLLDPADIEAWRGIQKKALGDVVPASTLLIVSRLARPEYRIEVEAIAAKD